MQATDPIYVFLHVPKTGGSTINRHLKMNLEYDETFVHLGGGGARYREEMDRPDWEDRSPEERNRARVLTGHRARYGIHQLVPDRTPRYVTVQREPAARIMSTYNFRMQRFDVDEDFDEWYAQYPRNNAFKWMRNALNLPGSQSFAEVADRVRELWFVGVTEHLNDDLPDLFRHFGAPSDAWINQRTSTPDETQVEESLQLPKADRWTKGNPTLQRETLTPELRERLNGDNKRDVKLYELALKRRERTLGNLHSE